ncbi:hypothetical protein UFOVP972_331 [uncultured Caudovirales phage]|uniref:Uncharacterized protein n=1 Tax=uncultured Caudovirales phage TaxID=2100421 RepID=A0A6J5Q2M4_9CAUD|nr:hypothetical protein UFOVP972_331 [uncultured Caudovirales phage]
MPFTPISLPIQQILMTNFVTDIATISNANVLLLQAKLEDLINDLEIDIATTSIGTTTPITSLKSQTVILQDTGLIYQAGSPTPTVIATLAKNISSESVLTVDHIVTNMTAGFDTITTNDITIANSATFTGTADFNAPVTINSSVVESKESVTANLTWAGVIGTPAETTITLSNTSRQNIFLTLKASTAPDPTPVYDGTTAIDPDISEFNIIIDFDLTNPPAQNTKFTIYLVDVINSGALTTIVVPYVQTAAIPIKFIAGTNLNTTNTILLHDNSNSVGVASSASYLPYGASVTFNYIIDTLNDDRLLATSLVGTSIF